MRWSGSGRVLHDEVEGAVEPGRVGGVTTISSDVVHTETHAGPAGVSSPALSARSKSLSGTSCSQAVGQPPARLPASAAGWCRGGASRG